eukprot:6183381-Pleurochrysis_carterae.AAC.5
MERAGQPGPLHACDGIARTEQTELIRAWSARKQRDRLKLLVTIVKATSQEPRFMRWLLEMRVKRRRR